MANHGRSGVLLITLATVAVLSVAGCSGFFVNPALTAITVTPLTPTITAKTSNPPTCPSGSVCTVQMTATGTFADGSTSTISASWSISPSDGSIATISAGGLVTGVAAGNATVTATSGTISGTTSVTVALANLASIKVTPTTPTVSLGTGSLPFTATGTFVGGGMQVITNQVTWTSTTISPAGTTVATISNSTGSKGLAMLMAAGSTTIKATSGNTSDSTTLTVTTP